MTQVLRGSVAGVFGVVLSLLPAVASAQGSSQDRVAAAIGKNVTVTMHDGTKHRGKLRAASATEVVLEQTTTDIKVPLGGVSEIQRDSRAIRTGAIIGLAAAAGAALIDLSTSDNSDMSTSSAVLGVPLAAGLGAAAGAGVGALFRPSAAARMVYQAPTKTTVSLSPTLGKGKVGVAGTIRW